MKTYIIPGTPVPLKRPRFTQDHVWDAQKEIKLIAGIHLKSQHSDMPFYIGPLSLTITFFLPIAKQSKPLSEYHMIKPDLDNLIKFVCDISNGILYTDDCVIARITSQKVYDKNPRTEFTIEEL